jgi:large conductance mechanosensitive channel protein
MKKKKKKSFFGQFREFVMRGNVLDMAVGVIVATAFGKITTSLVNDVIMPVIGWLIGDFDLSRLNITLSPAVLDASGAVVKSAVTIGIGTLLVTVIDFLLIAFVVFCLIKTMNTARDFTEAKLKKKEEEEEKAEEAKGPTTEELLTQILAELKKTEAK